MRKVIFTLTAVLLVLSFAGCAKPRRLTPEEEYRLRQERRQREARRRHDRITSLSGLNDVELDALERSYRRDNLNPAPGSFVYSVREKNPHSSTRFINELNEDGQQRSKEYQKSVREKNSSGRNWVYGL